MSSLHKIAQTKDAERIGNKAVGLHELADAGCRVPEFCVLDQEFLATYNGEGETVLQEIRKCFHEPPGLWAVRSSASIEDGRQKSFAGQFTTRTNVHTEDLPQAIEAVVEGYALVDSDFGYGVIIQKMIPSEYSLVIFTHDPINPEEPAIHINIVRGEGEGLVTGEKIGQVYRIKEGQLVAADPEKNDFLPILEPFVAEILAKTFEILEKKNGIPLDFECSIKSGKLYWLQVRPMTTPEKQEPKAVWDNTHAEGNYPGLSSPLTISFFKRTVSVTNRLLAQRIGIPKKRIFALADDFNNMCGGINGRVYYNITAWQRLMTQMPLGKMVAKKLPSLWGKEKSQAEIKVKRPGIFYRIRTAFRLLALVFRYKKLRKEFDRDFEKIFRDYRSKNMGEWGLEQYTAAYDKIEHEFGRLWLVPSLNGLRLAVLNAIVQKLWGSSGTTGNNVAMLNEQDFSTRAVTDLNEIGGMVQGSEELMDIFEKGHFSDISERSKAIHPELFQKINSYIQTFGARAVDEDLKLETVNYRIDPDLLVERIRRSLKANLFSDKKKSTAEQNPASQTKERWPKSYFLRNLKDAFKDRETFRYYRSEVYDLVRDLALATGRQLHTHGALDSERDVFFLSMHELFWKTRLADYQEIKAAAQGRKEDYDRYKELPVYHRYIQYENEFKPYIEMPDGPTTDVIRGTACSSGLVQGKVMMVSDIEKLMGTVRGKIIVAENIRPEWMNLLLDSAGIVSERGNLLSHTSILCREFGIPCIVGVKNIMSVVNNGDSIIMNGETGEVFITNE